MRWGTPTPRPSFAARLAHRGIIKFGICRAPRENFPISPLDRLIEIGHDMPTSEVNYEQSMVAPVCEVLAQVHLAVADTGERRYFDAVDTFLPALLAFNGEQPDHHLHDVAIRHWDGYWFGKRRLYGDTFPHYWSTIALVLDFLARAEHERAEAHRAPRVGHRGQQLLAVPPERGGVMRVPVPAHGERSARRVR